MALLEGVDPALWHGGKDLFPPLLPPLSVPLNTPEEALRFGGAAKTTRRRSSTSAPLFSGGCEGGSYRINFPGHWRETHLIAAAY